MARSTEIGLWMLVLVVLAGPFVYLIWCSPSKEFWDSVASGMLSTAAALIAGIPFALWIDRTIKHREEKKLNKQERVRELELLELIKEELTFTSSSFEQRMGDATVLAIQPLKSSLWSAVIAAGKINIISNHRLLNRLVSAYYVIDVVKKIEEHAYHSSKVAHDSLNGIIVTTGMTRSLIKDARKFDSLLSESITEALNDIDRELSASI